jgi:deoxyribose-phosphate aldolase
MLKPEQIAQMIDHSMLKPEFSVEQIRQGCLIARKYGTATVCVRPCDVALAKETLTGSAVLVSTVIGFPHGSNLTAVKLLESELAIRDGAVELDMVLNISRLVSGDDGAVAREIEAVTELAHRHQVIVKVILENCYLTDEMKVRACRICEQAGADFVKTSTGFGTSGATVDDLILMRRSCSGKVRIKAAGGIRNLDMALQVRRAGADRFGASATEEIMEEAYRRAAAGTLQDLD